LGWPFFIIFVVMINDVRNSVMFILNKDNNGYITPEEFNAYARMAQLNIFNMFMDEYNKGLVQRNKSIMYSGLSDVARRSAENIESFVVDTTLSITGGFATIPANTYMILQVYNGNTLFDKVTSYEQKMLSVSNLTQSSDEYPTYSVRNSGISVVAGSSVTSIGVQYIRTPNDPKWTYYTDPQTGSPLFDISNSQYQDFEIPKDHQVDLVYEILKLAGVSIRESEVVDAVTKQQVFNAQMEA